MEADLLLALTEEVGCIHGRRTGVPDAFNHIDIFFLFGEEIFDFFSGRNNPLLGVSNPALGFLATVELSSEGRGEDCSSCLLGVEPSSGFQAHAICEGGFQLFDERGVGLAEQFGRTAVDRQNQGLLVLGDAVLVHQEHEDQATALVRARLARVLLFPLVIEVGITGVLAFDAALVGVFNEGDVLAEASVEDHHARRLEEDALVLVAIVVRVDVLLGFREHIGVTGPTDKCLCVVLQVVTTLGFVVVDLGHHQIAHFALILVGV